MSNPARAAGEEVLKNGELDNEVTLKDLERPEVRDPSEQLNPASHKSADGETMTANS